jgi:membrane-associated phospholipid phosphatase
MALRGAAAGVLLLALTWYAAHYVGFVKQADVSILSGFFGLGHQRLDGVTSFIANLCDPGPYLFLAAVPVLAALLRGRPRVAVTIGVILLGANTTTHLLKPALAAPHDILGAHWISQASFPSGHATASMTLALCAVIATPARRRPLVATLMAAFTVAVCFSFLQLGWHYPSDVLGGFLVAGTWTLLGIAGLSTYEARRPALARRAAVGERSPAYSVREALAPAVALVVAAVGFAGLIALARPHEVLDYARWHSTFIVGAAAIAALSFTFASGLMLMLRRPQ